MCDFVMYCGSDGWEGCVEIWRCLIEGIVVVHKVGPGK